MSKAKPKTKTLANQIARYLIQLAAKEQEPEFLTHMRLQKLLYYIQGWHLALRGNPLFHEPVEAWKHGPVINSVYLEFKKFGDKPIPPEEVKSPAAISPDEQAFADSIWEGYKRFSAIELRARTHKELPWLKAREGLGTGESSREEISQRVMAEFFQSEYRKTQIEGLELEKVMKMSPPSKVRQGKPFHAILAEAGVNDAAA